MLAVMKIRNGEISGMLLVRVYAIDFLRLSKISRPVDRQTDTANEQYPTITTATHTQRQREREREREGGREDKRRQRY